MVVMVARSLAWLLEKHGPGCEMALDRCFAIWLYVMTLVTDLVNYSKLALP